MSTWRHGRTQAEQRHSGETGQALAEFAVILFVLMLIVMGIVDFSRLIYARSVVASAAREGARYGIVSPDDTAGITSCAENLVVGLYRPEDPAHPVVVNVTPPDAQGILQVEVTYQFRAVTPLIAQFVDGGTGSGITLRAVSRMRVEQ